MASPFSPDVPFRPSRVPFFYGWVVVAASTLGVLASIPGQTIGVSVFTDPLIAATGVSRLELSTAYLVGTLASGLTLPFGGSLLDRLGARVVVVLASLALSITLLFFSVIDSAIELLGGGAVVGLGVLVGAFFALRFSGQGMLTLVSRTMLGKWFDRRRGLVAGVSGIFVAFGFAAAPLGLSFAIDGAGWRGAWRWMALAVGFGMAAVGWLLFRDNPEQCGLRMDGARTDAPPSGGSLAAPTAPAEPERGYTRAQAVRTLAFWAVTLGLAAQGLLITGVTFHIVDIGARAGLAKPEVISIFLPMAALSTVTGLAVGWAADRVRVQWLLCGMMVAQAVGVSSIARLDQPLFYWLATAGLGISGGCFAPISTVAIPRFFGRVHLGAVNGLVMMCVVIGSALGPSILALSEATTGGYATGLYLGCVFPMVAFLLAARAEDPPLRGSRSVGQLR